jgi:predicted tellurium resistance membrane protein TerC
MPARAAPDICIFFCFFLDNAAAKILGVDNVIVFMASVSKIETKA